MTTLPVLNGLRVLFVEDDALLSLSTTDVMERMGCTVFPAMSMESASAILDGNDPEVAVLDVNVGGAHLSAG
jgi:DNA-binding response OmpR family regulator